MNNKLNIIENSVSEIREILGAECASIDQLPELIRSQIGTSAVGSGNSTAFLFSNSNYPGKPTGNTLDLQTGLVTNPGSE